MLNESYFIIEDLYNQCIREYENIRRKKERLIKWLYYHKKILNLRQNYFNPNDRIYYATYTFKESKLNNNDFKHDSFIKYLNRNGIKGYSLFRDYGDLKGRIHLHGFIYSEKILNNNSLNLYGWVKLKDISNEPIGEEEPIINYITNYVIKNEYIKQKCFTKYFTHVYNYIEEDI